ncbi:MAG: ATP-binding protein, partial [Lachnospiraceae bacterium]|nr:ATP-binding protein [Lachnospiraceae bacterium]
MKRLLPLGLQDFARIRKRGFCYVDKTARIHELITGSAEVCFLSRPRRFGKSLLCSTLWAIFAGKRELFGEFAGRGALAIDSLEWEWKKHPVIWLDLSPENYTEDAGVLDSLLHNSLDNIAADHGLQANGETVAQKFANLIKDMRNRFGEEVVVIVDEYDAPLLGTINQPEIHEQLREKLKGFYGVLKANGAYLRFVFLTGVTKFSHVSIFSNLNNLADLTLDPKYADICGLTEEEVFENYEPEIAGILAASGKSRAEYVGELRRFYNGYRFTKKQLKVYNPFGLLHHLHSGGDFQSYWYDTGTPTFLIKLIREQKINILDLNSLQVELTDFQRYDIKDMMAEPILYQSGYLTIADFDEKAQMYSLDYPNEEVRSCFARSLLDHFMADSGVTPGGLNIKLANALHKGDIDGAMAILRQFLAAIPYDIVRESENYYQTAVFLIFKMLGFDCRAEVRIAAGRIDTLVEMPDYIYCFEF